MRIVPSVPAVIGLLLQGASPAVAQYDTTANDTLWYREETRGSVVMQPPTGTVTVRSLHDALIGVTFRRPGRAAAWYESLALEQDGPGAQHRQPDTQPVLGQQFVLSFDGSGKVATDSTPTFPPEIAAITDLTLQFDDFFISLPPGELRVGVTWADTLVRDRSDRPEDSYRSRHVRSYRVARDTMVAGMEAWVIDVRREIAMEATSPLQQPGLSAATNLAGTEKGIAVFSTELGRLLARERRGRFEGEFRVIGGLAPVAFPQIFEYESRLTLQQ